MFSIIDKLYTDRHSAWLETVDEDDIDVGLILTINRFLVCNDEVRVQARFLDKYTFNIPPKMWLSLAWSILPKFSKAPFIRYIKSIDEEDEWGFIMNKIRRHLELSDNDYKSVKGYLIDAIKNNKVEWFSAYGIDKPIWKKHGLDFNDMKKYGNRVIAQKGLEAWGM
jgi:hypothetical protein